MGVLFMSVGHTAQVWQLLVCRPVLGRHYAALMSDIKLMTYHNSPISSSIILATAVVNPVHSLNQAVSHELSHILILRHSLFSLNKF